MGYFTINVRFAIKSNIERPSGHNIPQLHKTYSGELKKKYIDQTSRLKMETQPQNLEISLLQNNKTDEINFYP